MKDGIRILGVDDSAFNSEDDTAIITGVVYRGTEFIEEIVFSEVKVDGEDATQQTIDLFDKTSNHDQIKVLMVDGLAYAGFNIIDIGKVADKIGKPVVAVTTNRPDREKFLKSLDEFGGREKVDYLDEYSEVDLPDGPAFFQVEGADEETAEKFIRKSVIYGRTPEPIRVAHLIGSSMPKL